MLITRDIFAAFLDCDTKAFLKSRRSDEINSEISDGEGPVLEDVKRKCWAQLLIELPRDKYLIRPNTLLRTPWNYRLLIDWTVQAKGVQSQIHAVELPSAAETATRGS